MALHHLRSGGPALALACAALTAHPGLASSQRTVKPDSIRHLQSVVPLTGPPGTMVSVRSQNLPLQAKVHVGVGQLDAGFEALGEAYQDELGEISATVRLPETVSWDRPVYFIAFNGVFSPIGLSDPFHVTTAEGMVRRTGRIVDAGGECLSLVDRDGLMYTLAGALGDARPGDEVAVEGRYSEAGTCGPGGAIDVARIAPHRTPK